MLQQYPTAPGYEDKTCSPCDDPTGRDDFLQQHKDCKRGDPRQIHYATHEQKDHQRPATADAVATVPCAERERPGGTAAEAPVTQDECER